MELTNTDETTVQERYSQHDLETAEALEELDDIEERSRQIAQDDTKDNIVSAELEIVETVETAEKREAPSHLTIDAINLEDYPLPVFTTTALRHIIKNLPLAKDDLPTVLVRGFTEDILPTVYDLMLIKALHTIYPGECEYTKISNEQSEFVVHIPEIDVVSTFGDTLKVKELYCKIILIRNEAINVFSLNDERSKQTIPVFTYGVCWKRAKKTVNEHIKGFILPHVSLVYDFARHDWTNCCIGESDLAMLKGLLLENELSFSIACMLLVSIASYAGSENSSDISSYRITQLSMLNQTSYNENILLDAFKEYLRHNSSLSNISVLVTPENFKLGINVDDKEFLDKMFAIQPRLKLYKDPVNPNIVGTIDDIPTETDVTKINEAKHIVLNFRKRDIYYRVENGTIPDVTTLVSSLHPDAATKINAIINNAASKCIYKLSSTAVSPDRKNYYNTAIITTLKDKLRIAHENKLNSTTSNNE